MKLAFWSFLVLAVLGILVVVSAVVPAARTLVGCCSCCGFLFNFIVIIAVTVVRYNEAGTFCAAPAGVANGSQVDVSSLYDQLNGIERVDISKAYSEMNYPG